jgi:hypothetical protein
MKKFLKIRLIAALLLLTAGSYASEGDFSVRLKRVNEKSITFFIDKAQVVDVSIYGADDEVLYEQKIKAVKASNKTYDLNAFPDGNYTFKLLTESRLAEYKIEIKDGKAMVSDPLIVEMFKPVLTKDDGVITLSLENAPAGPIEVSILGEYSDPLYSKVFEGDSKLIKKFNVARIDLNELTFIIKSKGQEFTKIVQMH